MHPKRPPVPSPLSSRAQPTLCHFHLRRVRSHMPTALRSQFSQLNSPKSRLPQPFYQAVWAVPAHNLRSGHAAVQHAPTGSSQFRQHALHGLGTRRRLAHSRTLKTQARLAGQSNGKTGPDPDGTDDTREQALLVAALSNLGRRALQSWQGTSRATATAEYTETESEAVKAATARRRRLELLVRLRKMYRNILRAERLLEQPSPVYQAAPTAPTANGRGGADGRWWAGKSAQPVRPAVSASVDAQEEEERQQAAVELVAEMQLTAEQLKSDLRALLLSGFGSVLQGDSPSDAEAQVVEQVQQFSTRLSDRANQELGHLPFPTRAAAQAALNARNARYRSGSLNSFEEEDSSGTTRRTRLEKAERVVEQFVTKRIQPAVQKVRETRPQGVLRSVQSSAAYARGLWVRLNGQGRQESMPTLPADLPLPTSSREARTAAINRLNTEVETLERQLRDASKTRETRLRKAGIQQRARLASELHDMDERVSSLARTLAIRTLQLEMEWVHGTLEDEALDIAEGGAKPVGLFRTGSSDEVALLVAEFGELDQGLAQLQTTLTDAEVVYAAPDDFLQLAIDIPDFRKRLGIPDNLVFGGQGWTLFKLRMQVTEGVGKVEDGLKFFWRGLRLLGSDVGNSGRLFWRAALGVTLKPREVMALRRTAKDLLTFIPFAIILIAPLTPVGHVLIFSFIQRYFPDFFPSQFNARRQELMIKYEELKKELAQAQTLALAEDEQAELERAAEAVARLTAPATAGGPAQAATRARDAAEARGRIGSLRRAIGWGGSEERDGPAAQALRNLQAQVATAERAAIMAEEESS